MKKLETLLLQSMKIIPIVPFDLLVGNQLTIGSPSGIKISETLVAAFYNIKNNSIRDFTLNDVEIEVINQACLMYFALQKQFGNDFSKRNFVIDDIATIYSFIAEASVEFYGEEEMIKAQYQIPQKSEWSGMWDYLINYYNSIHNIEIEKLIKSL